MFEAIMAVTAIVSSYATGFMSGRFLSRRKAAPSVSTARCGCGHPLALHSRDPGECGGEVRRKNYWKNGTRNGYAWVQCDCRQYVGPRPVEELFAQQYITPKEDA